MLMRGRRQVIGGAANKTDGVQTMQKRRCTCGAVAHVRRRIRRLADGSEEVIHEMSCPVCGQTGPAIPEAGSDEASASAAAVQAWNDMIARLRPMES